MAETTAFRVMLRMQIFPGKEKEFEKVWYAGSDVIGRQAGNLGQWLMRGEDEEEGVYYIMSDWVDETAFRAFEGTDEHIEHRTQLHPYRSKGSMATMNIVYALGGPATTS
ncbi:antibiotic biosynthesis monooxygenase [Spongiactinospora gelatinilytica]|uniref:Antibiotic biosynthesis monooxygenase n=1 Tax=Spongiactinospora gelatinilytica TaxID=2666298 RepID=A0A2W2FAA9_9ACTN|nr:antibiotic biosynthesis monooxygenase family protein [Spongiactinospora gelatinilytica]PZG25225.1 antibiotic biosynthesis monooxygenase [Spongiactinospora gelatinilytica]